MTKEYFKREIADEITLEDFDLKQVQQIRDFIHQIRRTLEDLGRNPDHFSVYQHELLSHRIIRCLWSPSERNRGVELITKYRRELHDEGAIRSTATTPTNPKQHYCQKSRPFNIEETT